MRRSPLLPLCLAALLAGLALPARAADAEPRYARRWFYAPFNLLVDKNTDELIGLIRRASRSGYNGMLLADYKFNVLDRQPPGYFKNVERVRRAAAEAGIEIIPAVCPIGYSDGILAHDPNLAEGLPVKDAPFLVRGKETVPDRAAAAHLANGDLEQTKGDRFPGFTLQDGPGQSSFADRAVVHHGKISCRMEDMKKGNPYGNCRLAQKVKVRPFTCFRFSAWVKTRDLQPARGFQLMVLGAARGRPLVFYDSRLKPTQGWTKVEVVFNSLAGREVILYAGVWGGKSGTLWLDDFRLEELPLVNVLRRRGTPLVVASADGKTVYEEGKDFQPVRDPKLGMVPYAGEYSYDHAGPALRLTENSQIKDGDRLRVSWYHPPIFHESQVMCCVSDPKVYEILRDQIRRVNALFRPKTFFLSHDEIRVMNWCRACRDRHLTPGELLADNVKRCVALIREVNPKAKLVIWSDMFDPYHNAVDNYFLVNGSLKGSWEGLPRGMTIGNWNEGKAKESLKWFADRGHPQIIAGYYDDGVDNFKRWDAAARGVPRILGFLYTTWEHKYGDLETYGRLMSRP